MIQFPTIKHGSGSSLSLSISPFLPYGSSAVFLLAVVVEQVSFVEFIESESFGAAACSAVCSACRL